ncbi:unnamed protein product [Zymoseptoria tritici ST99CH_1A5]|uniref:Uncharacterized protein n=1 Tax=Zymoseptoria tritici ST99CH_1A5 TaxID=1276529 RepID=A0A1Y6LUZ0_ZYMTR|nr:unnamed protein product [Zymoseptoria tritici ST99CH_1A5]
MAEFAIPVPDDVVKQSGTLSRFPTAVHREHARCLAAANKIRDDFAAQVDSDLDAKTTGHYPALGAVHVVAFTIPECLPERLALMTRFTDFTIMNDDYYDAVDRDQATSFNAELQRSLGRDSHSNTVQGNASVAIKTKQFQASILVEMMVMDRDLAMDVMNTYSDGLETATFPPSDICTIEEYLPVRLVNCGLDVFQEMSCFGLGVHLTKAEKEKLSEIANTALYTAALINDCHSWPKELKHHLETPGSDVPFNAVCILMRQFNCSDVKAIERLRAIYVDIQERHLSLVRNLEQSEGSIPETHRKYIMAAQYAASGSEFWSLYAPRYASKEDLDQPEYVLVGNVFHRRSTSDKDLARADSAMHISTIKTAGSSGMSHMNEAYSSTTATEMVARGAGSEIIHTEIDSNGSKELAPNGAQSRVQKPSEDAVRAPYDYIRTLPSKRIRETFIDALDSWLAVPAGSSTSIKSIIGMLHQSSLMLDDIEDDSTLRRGKPTAHTLFGTAQTINSANWVFVCAFEELRQLRGVDAATVFVEELKNLHCGQALDLHWKHHTYIPSVDEYLNMVDHKTGGLFRLCVRLMQGESSTSCHHIDAERFITLLGRYFQIRDDYQNLVSDEYTNQKGFCEDLDEGKISLPLIYCLAGSDPTQIMIKGILQHKRTGEMPLSMKKLILEKMRSGGALNATISLLKDLQDDILEELKSLELAFGSGNPMLELVLRSKAQTFAQDGSNTFAVCCILEIAADIADSPIPYLMIILALAAVAVHWSDRSSNPLLNAKGFFELSDRRIKIAFLGNARPMLSDWFGKHQNSPVSIYSDTGVLMVLPGSMANEIRNDKRFHLRQQVERMMHGRLPGFEVFRDAYNNHIVKTVINRDLTKQLAKVTTPLVDEISVAVSELFGSNSDWHELTIQTTILELVARTSSRVFLGAELCHNPEWLKVSKEYAVLAFLAAQDLRLWSPWLRPIASLFLSKCRLSRAAIHKARATIEPVLAERSKVVAKNTGGKATVFDDAIAWIECAAGTASYDPQIVQLSLSAVAVHTTTDLLSQALADIAAHPEIIAPLREEMISIMNQDGGLQTASLGRMELLDSCIKESQRMKPLSIASMGRIATERVTLSNGTVIPKGQSILVDSSRMWDAKVHPSSPKTWDGYRFLRMREDPMKRDMAPLVSTSPDHIAFGYGVHACPGRFFAANEVKIALIYILLKYELRFEEGQMPRAFDHGFTCVSDPSLKLSVRRRTEATVL